MVVSFTLSLLEGTEEILGCKIVQNWKFWRFCVLLTEVEQLVKENNEVSLESNSHPSKDRLRPCTWAVW